MATRADLRTRARLRADQDAGQFPTDTQYNLYLDEAAREVFGDLIAAGWPPDFSTTSITANGSASYVVGGSDAVFAIRGVYNIVGNQRYELKRLNEGDRASLRSQGAQGPARYYDPRVSLTLGPVVELFPRPTSGTYEVDYVVDHPGFASDVAVWRGPNRSDELLVLCAARKGVLKEGRLQDAQTLLGEYQYLFEKVQRTASWFDMRNAPTIRDVGDQFTVRDAFDYDV